MVGLDKTISEAEADGTGTINQYLHGPSFEAGFNPVEDNYNISKSLKRFKQPFLFWLALKTFLINIVIWDQI